MAYTVVDHGRWVLYQPNPLPEWVNGLPVLFAKREADGVDWYAFRNKDGQFFENSVIGTTELQSSGVEIVQGVFRDETLAFPSNMRIIEILGVDPTDPVPHKIFEQKVFDLASLTFSDQPAPRITRVAASQAKIQLSRMPLNGSTLLALTEDIVSKSGDVELQIWFRDARYWNIDSPNVQKIGGIFDLTPDEIQGAFDAASKIEE